MVVSGQFYELAALPPGKEPLLPTGKEAEWALETVWTSPAPSLLKVLTHTMAPYFFMKHFDITVPFSLTSA
jgi:hypothetical protein